VDEILVDEDGPNFQVSIHVRCWSSCNEIPRLAPRNDNGSKTPHPETAEGPTRYNSLMLGGRFDGLTTNGHATASGSRDSQNNREEMRVLSQTVKSQPSPDAILIPSISNLTMMVQIQTW